MKKVGSGFLLSALVLALVATMIFSRPLSVVAQDEATVTAVRVETASSNPFDTSWTTVPTLSVALLSDEIEPAVKQGIVFDLAQEITLQAAYTDDTLYIRAVWPDATENNTRGLWTFTENGWVKNPLNEDRVAFMFDITGNRQFVALGCGAACHTATGDTPAYMGFAPDSTDAVDLWHWKGTRTIGYADDQWAGAFINEGEEPTGRGNDAKDSGGYADNVNEAGDGPKFTYPVGQNPQGPLFAETAVEITSDMAFEIGQTIPFYLQSRPVGSRGDISTNARYVSAEDGSGWWYVVLSRALNTGNPDDTVFVLNSENTFGVAVFNNSGDHTVNDGRLILRIGE